MEIKLYPLLSKKSQKAIRRKKKCFGLPYKYNPRSILINRLVRETGMTYEQVFNQLKKEREYILQFPQYYP